MNLGEALLSEFDREMATTRRLLERVPNDKFAWKPHEKSMAFGQLAIHVVEIPEWAAVTLDEDSFDFAPVGGPPYTAPKLESSEALVEYFDKGVRKAREALAGISDEKMNANWSLLSGGQTFFSMPRAAVVRSFVISHLVHHRAQLGVYLRLNDIPVPSMYGPTADES